MYILNGELVANLKLMWVARNGNYEMIDWGFIYDINWCGVDVLLRDIWER
jgi:hypothetical protein